MTEEVIEEAIVDNEGNKVELDDKGEPVKGEEPTERPAWLPEKFKTPEELSKSYDELQKTLREKGKVAPEKYEVEEGVDFNTEDEMFTQFQEFAKENNMSNEVFNKTLKFAKESGLLDVPDYETEMKKLGSEKEGIIKSITSFAETKLNEQEQQVLGSLVYTAEQARLINKLIRGNNPTSIPVNTDSAPDDSKSLQKKLDTMLANPNIRNDRSMQAEAAELATKIAASRK